MDWSINQSHRIDMLTQTKQHNDDLEQSNDRTYWSIGRSPTGEQVCVLVANVDDVEETHI